MAKTTGTAIRRHRSIAVALVCGLLGVASAQSQNGAANTAKEPRFDVISIRRSLAGTGEGFTTNITPDGYRARGQSMYSTIMAAISREPWMSWSKERFSGAPAWVTSELYDIDAKVAAEDVAEWQKQGNTPAQTEMLHAMLQAALAERCGLRFHLAPGEGNGFELVVVKRGIKFEEAGGGVPAAGMLLPDGGKLVGGPQLSFYGVSMADFIKGLTIMSGGPNGRQQIQNGTGLVGRYDLVLPRRDSGDAGDSGPTPWDLDAVGLMLRAVKIPVEKIVVDHVERPTEN